MREFRALLCYGRSSLNVVEAYTDVVLEARVLGLCFRSKEGLEWKQRLCERHFTLPLHRLLFRFLAESNLKFTEPDSWWSLLEPYAAARLDEEELSDLRELFYAFWEDDVEPSEEVFDSLFRQLDSFLYGREVYQEVKRAVDLFREGEPMEARSVLERAVLARTANKLAFQRGDFLERYKVRMRKYRESLDRGEVVLHPVGIPAIDRLIPGVPKGALCFLSGKTNLGKTFLLQEIALSGVGRKLRVLFVTVELSMEVIESRWDARISGIPLDYFLLRRVGSFSKWKSGMDSLAKKYREGARLAVSYMPEGVNAAAIDAEISHWESKWGKPCDMVVVDYADLLKAMERSYSEQDELGNIFRELKRLAQRRNVVVWTASQTSKMAYALGGVGRIEDVGYSMKKTFWSNLVIGMSQDKEEELEGIIRLKVLKYTYGPKGGVCYIKPDFSLSLVDVGDEEEGDFDESDEE